MIKVVNAIVKEDVNVGVQFPLDLLTTMGHSHKINSM
jgi:hypothetical protein